MLGQIFIFVLLTMVTQMGGVIWLIARQFRHNRIWIFLVIYLLMLGLNTKIAPHFGREALPCWGDTLVKSRSPVFCLLNRNYVTPKMLAMLRHLARDVEEEFPASVTHTLDASFPFLPFPLVPHLSHHDGKEVDLAYFYERYGAEVDGTPSPLGYFAYEYPTREQCPRRSWDLRWDLRWAQKFWGKGYALDETRMKFLLDWLDAHQAQYGIDRVRLEPHLKARLDAQSPLIRFQGCYAARHDDHLHIEIR